MPKQEEYEGIKSDIYWAIMTINEKLSFGLDPLNAALAREIRAKSVLKDALDFINKKESEENNA